MSKHRFEPRPGVALAIDPAALSAFYEAPKKAPYETINGVAVVRIEGPLSHRAGGWCDSYDEIRARCSAAFAARPASVMLVLDTPGGEVSGCFELVRDLRAMSATASIPLYSYADGMAASAGYALATAGARIFGPATAIVGSIGVISGLFDMTKALESYGMRVELVTSGKRKADGHPANPIQPDAVAALQGMVDTLAGMFFGVVSEGRPTLTIERQRALEAGVVLGADAVREGLIDEVATLDAALAFAARRAPAAPAPASAGPTNRVARVATTAPQTKAKAIMSTKNTAPRIETAPSDEEDKDKTEGEPKAAMEECDLAKLREAMAMPDQPAQEVVDAAAAKLGEAEESDDEPAPEGESASAKIAGLMTAMATLRDANTSLSARVATLEPFAAAHAEREREAAVDAAMSKHGVAATHRQRFLDLAKKHGAAVAIDSIAASHITPPMGTVGGPPPVSSTGAKDPAAAAVSGAPPASKSDERNDAVAAEVKRLRETGRTDAALYNDAIANVRAARPDLY